MNTIQRQYSIEEDVLAALYSFCVFKYKKVYVSNYVYDELKRSLGGKIQINDMNEMLLYFYPEGAAFINKCTIVNDYQFMVE